MSNLLKYERFIIYIVLFFLVIKLLKEDTKETFNIPNPNPDYDPIAIANLSNFVDKYHDKIENLSNLLDQDKSLTFPNITATTGLTTKGGTDPQNRLTKLPFSDGNNYIRGPTIIDGNTTINGTFCIGNICINKNQLQNLRDQAIMNGTPMRLRVDTGGWLQRVKNKTQAKHGYNGGDAAFRWTIYKR